jgi:beta-lactamase regulating signal transducer with metallopeptidase domain
LFSDEEYNKLISGEDVSFAVPEVAENEMIVAFIVTLEELNKFTTQTVEGDEDSAITYAILALVIAGLIGGSFYFFVVVKRKKSEEEEEEEEIIEDNDFYY